MHSNELLSDFSEEEIKRLTHLREELRGGRATEFPINETIRDMARQVVRVGSDIVREYALFRPSNNAFRNCYTLSAVSTKQIDKIFHTGKTYGELYLHDPNSDCIINFRIDPSEHFLRLTKKTEENVQKEEFVLEVLTTFGQRLGFLNRGENLQGILETNPVTERGIRELVFVHPASPLEMITWIGPFRKFSYNGGFYLNLRK